VSGRNKEGGLEIRTRRLGLARSQQVWGGGDDFGVVVARAGGGGGSRGRNYEMREREVGEWVR